MFAWRLIKVEVSSDVHNNRTTDWAKHCFWTAELTAQTLKG